MLGASQQRRQNSRARELQGDLVDSVLRDVIDEHAVLNYMSSFAVIVTAKGLARHLGFYWDEGRASRALTALSDSGKVRCHVKKGLQYYAAVNGANKAREGSIHPAASNATVPTPVAATAA